MLELNRKFVIFSSQSCFWFALVLCGIPQLRTQIQWHFERSAFPEVNKYAEYNFASYILFYGISFIIWFLNCFADEKTPFGKNYPKFDVSFRYATIRDFFVHFFYFLCSDHAPRRRPVSFLDYSTRGLMHSYGEAIRNHYKIEISGTLRPKKRPKKLCRSLINIGIVRWPNRLN